MDTKIGYTSFPFEVHGAEIPQRRVSACRIVKAFDVIEHVGSGLIAGAVCFAGDPLGFERREEALHRGPFGRLRIKLSQTLPDRLIEQVPTGLIRTPHGASAGWKADCHGEVDPGGASGHGAHLSLRCRKVNYPSSPLKYGAYTVNVIEIYAVN